MKRFKGPLCANVQTDFETAVVVSFGPFPVGTIVSEVFLQLFNAGILGTAQVGVFCSNARPSSVAVARLGRPFFVPPQVAANNAISFGLGAALSNTVAFEIDWEIDDGGQWVSVVIEGVSGDDDFMGVCSVRVKNPGEVFRSSLGRESGNGSLRAIPISA